MLQASLKQSTDSGNIQANPLVSVVIGNYNYGQFLLSIY
jgi:hypothetical protein